MIKKEKYIAPSTTMHCLLYRERLLEASAEGDNMEIEDDDPYGSSVKEENAFSDDVFEISSWE